MARRFEALARLWDAVGEFGVGFCLDTCHAFAAGEDLVDVVERARAITGRIDLVHLNDSPRRVRLGARSARQHRRGHDRSRAARRRRAPRPTRPWSSRPRPKVRPRISPSSANGWRAAPLRQARDLRPGPAVTRSDVRRTGRARGEAPTPPTTPRDVTASTATASPGGGTPRRRRDARAPPARHRGCTAAPTAGVRGAAGRWRTRGRPRWAALDPRRWSTRVVAAVIVLLTAVMLLVAYAGKARCVGPTFDDKGRTTPDYDIRIDRDLCYSDIQYLWLDRDIDKHVFPYVHGGITPPPDSKLTGGTVEYPVLTGLLMWAGGDVRPQRRRVPALLGAADGPVRPAHRVDARQARAVARARVGARATAVPLRLPQLGPARRGVRGGRGLRGARLAHAPVAAPTRHARRGAARPRLRVQALPRRVRRRR